VKAAAGLKVKTAWLDGEIVVVLASGLTSFQRLQNALSNAATEDLRYFLFDLPYLDGHDLRQLPLVERKRLLEKILGGAPRVLSYSSHVAGSGETFYSEACRLRLEGIVSKKAQSVYRAGRTRDWLGRGGEGSREFTCARAAVGDAPSGGRFAPGCRELLRATPPSPGRSPR